MVAVSRPGWLAFGLAVYFIAYKSSPSSLGTRQKLTACKTEMSLSFLLVFGVIFACESRGWSSSCSFVWAWRFEAAICCFIALTVANDLPHSQRMLFVLDILNKRLLSESWQNRDWEESFFAFGQAVLLLPRSSCIVAQGWSYLEGWLCRKELEHDSLVWRQGSHSNSQDLTALLNSSTYWWNDFLVHTTPTCLICKISEIILEMEGQELLSANMRITLSQSRWPVFLGISNIARKWLHYIRL